MTGATGFLGRYLARALLEQGEELVSLTRGKSKEEAFKRTLRSILDAPTYKASATLNETVIRQRLRICTGSLSEESLGLNSEDRDYIRQTCDQFINCAATVSFSQSLSDARRVNVQGTRAVLNLAKERMTYGSVKRFDHISTAYVAGRRSGLVYENDLEHSAGHKNTYEQSKYEAEMELRQWMDRLPISVFRPSIIVGDSQTGHTSSFKMLYWPAKIYSSGLWRIAPGRPKTPIDLIPVDFVRDAIMLIRQRSDTVNKSYHIAAGPHGDMTLEEICRLIESFFPGRKPIKIVNPDIWLRFFHPIMKHAFFGRLRRLARVGEFYIPYFTQNPEFDITNTIRILQSDSFKPPKLRDYFTRIMQYCIDTDWGRKPFAPLPH